MKYSRNAKNRANTGEWLVRCTLDSSKLIRNTSGRFMIDRSITECLSNPFISISFGNSFGKSYIRFFSSKFKNLPRIGSFALARNLYRDERNSPLCKFFETEFLEKNILFAREKGRRERKIGGEREEEEEEKKELPRVWRRRKGTRVHFVRAYPTYHLYWCPSGVNR